MTSPTIKLPNEPILVYTAPPVVDDESNDIMFSSIAGLLDEHGPCYLIANTSQSNLSFPSVILVMKAQARGGPGTAADTRITEAVFVGSRVIAGMLRDLMAHSAATNQRHVPVFSDYDEALAFIRARIQLAANTETPPDVVAN